MLVGRQASPMWKASRLGSSSDGVGTSSMARMLDGACATVSDAACRGLGHLDVSLLEAALRQRPLRKWRRTAAGRLQAELSGCAYTSSCSRRRRRSSVCGARRAHDRAHVFLEHVECRGLPTLEDGGDSDSRLAVHQGRRPRPAIA